MRRAAMLVGVAVVALLAATGCEPKMTIKAKPDNSDGYLCGITIHVVGSVNPIGATPKVVLQQTLNHQWVDVKGWASADDWYAAGPATARTANVRQGGTFSIPYYVDWPNGTKHLRVRSNGGGADSGDFYVTPVGVTDGCS